MNKKIQILILFLLIAFMNSPAYAYAGMGAQNSTQINNLTNTTGSDQDIALVQHLIELSPSENDLSITETLVFKNVGTKNYSGSLSTWIPDDATKIGVAKIGMMTEAEPSTIPYALEKVQKGNITIWSAAIQPNDYPMYGIGYQIPQNHYSKILLYPTRTKQPASFIIKLNLNNNETASITDGNGNNIMTSAITGENIKGSYRWENPQFTELNVEITKSAVVTPSGFDNLGIYLVIGVLILLVFSYPLLRTKSGKLREFEGRIRGSFKKEEPEEEDKEVEIAPKKPKSEKKASQGNNSENDGLEKEKNELLSKLSELDKKYASGDLMDEEYDELRRPYQKRLKEIKKLM